MNYVPIIECVGTVDKWNPRNSSNDSPFKYIDLSSVDRISKSIVKTSEIFPVEAPSRARQLVNADDVLVATVRPNLNGVAVVPESLNGATASTGFCVLRPQQDNLNHRYLFHWVKSPKFIQAMVKESIGANYPAVSDKTVKNSKIPLPPLTEQEHIASILDKADAIRRKRQEAIDLADTFLRSVFLKMFGDPVTNPMGWDEKPFGDVVLNIFGGWSAKGDDRPPNSDEMAVLKVSAVTYGVYRPEECKVVANIPKSKKLVIPQVGDLLFSRANTRQLVAATCIVTEAQENVFLPDKLWRIDCDKELVLPEFIKFLFSHPRFREQMSHNATGTSGSMLNISKKKLLDVTVPIPDHKKQREFADLFWKMNSTFRKLHQASDISNNLFSSLQQRAFRGDL
jgi:type I restriction enzyme S subunit